MVIPPLTRNNGIWTFNVSSPAILESRAGTDTQRCASGGKELLQVGAGALSRVSGRFRRKPETRRKGGNGEINCQKCQNCQISPKFEPLNQMDEELVSKPLSRPCLRSSAFQRFLHFTKKGPAEADPVFCKGRTVLVICYRQRAPRSCCTIRR